MTTYLIVLLAVSALALCSVREDNASDQPRRQKLRASGWKHVAWIATQAVFGAALVLLVAALRTGLYGALLGIAGVAVLLASFVSLDRRPVRVHRLEIRA